MELLAKKIFFPNDDSFFLLLQDCNGCLGCSRKAKEGIQRKDEIHQEELHQRLEKKQKGNITSRYEKTFWSSGRPTTAAILLLSHTHAHMLFIQHLIISRQMSHLRVFLLLFLFKFLQKHYNILLGVSRPSKSSTHEPNSEYRL